MPKAILLDLDDTIVAWEAVADTSWQKICHRFASRVDRLEVSRLITAIKETRDWYWSDPVRHSQGRLNLTATRRELIAIALNRLGIDDPALAREIADAYKVEREKAIFIVPGAIDTLNHLRNCGCHLALITNGSSESQREKIRRFKLAPLFDYILIEEEFGVGKPDKRFFLHVLDKLESKSAEAWMVGDDLERDVAGAQSLGVYGIWMDWRCEGLPESTSVQPDRIINTLSELSMDNQTQPVVDNN